MSELQNSLLELSRRTSAEIPDDVNQAILASLEQDILKTANELDIGPMGFGGKTTLLGVKICAAISSIA